jgi:hypothetical protein
MFWVQTQPESVGEATPDPKKAIIHLQYRQPARDPAEALQRSADPAAQDTGQSHQGPSGRVGCTCGSVEEGGIRREINGQ